MRKKHEIVESVVLSVCEAFGIEDWRKLQNKTQEQTGTVAKYTVVNFISSEIGCSFAEVHHYFPMYNKLGTYSSCQSRLLFELNTPSVKRNFLKAKSLMRQYFLLKPELYDVLIIR